MREIVLLFRSKGFQCQDAGSDTVYLKREDIELQVGSFRSEVNVDLVLDRLATPLLNLMHTNGLALESKQILESHIPLQPDESAFITSKSFAELLEANWSRVEKILLSYFEIG